MTEDFVLFEVFAEEIPPLHLHRYAACEEGCAALPVSGAIPSPPMQTQHQQKIPGCFFSCCCPGGRGRDRWERRELRPGRPGAARAGGAGRAESPGAAASGESPAPSREFPQRRREDAALRDFRNAGPAPPAGSRGTLAPPGPLFPLSAPPAAACPHSPRSAGISPVPSEPLARPTPLPRPQVSPPAPGAGPPARPCRGSPSSAAPGVASRAGRGGKRSLPARGSPPGAERGAARPQL